MNNKVSHRVCLTIDANKLRRNFERIAQAVKPAKVLVVLKANAYGLGVNHFAGILKDRGAYGFAVAEPVEALELREQLPPNTNVHVLSSILPDEVEAMLQAGIILPITCLESAQLISKIAKRMGVQAHCHLKMDTGMGRLGIVSTTDQNMPQAVKTITQISTLPNLVLDGIFSHCPMAYDPTDPFTAQQITRFKRLIVALSAKGIAFKYRHIAASDAINNFPQAYHRPFNLVRTGINLHGSFDPNGKRALAVESVLTLTTRISQVRTLEVGTTLGYGRTWSLPETRRIATIAAGYADALPLALSNRGKVLINGQYAPIVGRISMDYATVDVTHLPNVKAGDQVVLLGQSGSHSITPDDWGAIKGTHAYDIICSLGTRVERVMTTVEA